MKEFKAGGHALERGHPARSVRGIAARKAGRMPALQGVFKAGIENRNWQVARTSIVEVRSSDIAERNPQSKTDNLSREELGLSTARRRSPSRQASRRVVKCSIRERRMSAEFWMLAFIT